MDASDIARKILLQVRSKLVVRRQELQKVFENPGDIQFLDLESSPTLWAEIATNGLSWPYPRHSHFKVHIEDNYDEVVSILAEFLSDISELEAFCFSEQWRQTGGFIASPATVASCLPKLMWVSNDWLNIFTPDLKRALLIDGDRTGTWDRLNDLQIYIYGEPWAKNLIVRGLDVRKY